MPGDKWFIKSIEQNLTADGYIIVIQTDVPSHLWMRWTVVLPHEHLIQRTKRGLAFLVDKYFCFDVYEDNEQEEAGDTLVHTFIKEPWPVCETRYFYFHGEISGVPSKSTTTIFKKHRTAPPFGPPQWIECPLTQKPVYHQAYDASWEAARTNLPHYSRWFEGEQARHWWSAPYHYIGRGGIVWDTSSIPSGSQIIQAYMRRYGYYIRETTNNIDFYYTWVDANAWGGGLDANDYPLWNSYTTVVAELLVRTTQTTRYWFDVPLTEAGLAAIVPAGLTKMVGKSRQDNINEDPNGYNMRYYRLGISADFPQILHVEYRPPL